MSIQPSPTIPITTLKCMYPDCGNEWIPRSSKLPKVCPKCKRYGWETGRVRKRKHRGGKNVDRATAHIGPATQKFLEEQRKKET